MEKRAKRIRPDDVKGVTLLSLSEFRKYKENISPPKFGEWWWLKSPGKHRGTAAIVNDEGEATDYGPYVDYMNDIRPVLVLKEPGKYKVGEKLALFRWGSGHGISYGGDTVNIYKKESDTYKWTVISDKLALCDEVTGHTPFCKDRYRLFEHIPEPYRKLDIYEQSDIKKELDRWFEEKTAQYEEDRKKREVKFAIPEHLRDTVKGMLSEENQKLWEDDYEF